MTRIFTNDHGLHIAPIESLKIIAALSTKIEPAAFSVKSEKAFTF
jgi:hypothetical protein